MISFVIRTKNEERWIGTCIQQIQSQVIDHEIEIIIVDNCSTDKTIEKALQVSPESKILNIQKFLPGLALNLGCEAASGDFIVCLSAHCPPVNEFWLSSLLSGFSISDDIAGVYGRQVPTSFTPPSDKRDLLVTFGLDRRLQVKDSFFHNANSIIRKDIWQMYPFDSDVTNIEDRLWGQTIINNGFKLLYEPEATVYHYHGIHQGNTKNRLDNIVRILETQVTTFSPSLLPPVFSPDKLNVCSVIPLRKGMCPDLQAKLLRRTIASAQQSSFINSIFVDTSDAELAELATSFGAIVPFLRPSEFASTRYRVDDILPHFLSSLEASYDIPDIVVTLEIPYPFRPPNLIDECLLLLSSGGYDSVVTCIDENRPCWKYDDGLPIYLNSSSISKNDRDSISIGLTGLVSASWSSSLRSGGRVSGNIGLLPITSQLYATFVDDVSTLHDINSALF